MPTNWDEKFLREAPFMPFGTLVQGWARVKAEDTEYTLEQYAKDAEKLFDIARGMVSRNYSDVRKAFSKSKSKKEDPEI